MQRPIVLAMFGGRKPLDASKAFTVGTIFLKKAA